MGKISAAYLNLAQCSLKVRRFDIFCRSGTQKRAAEYLFAQRGFKMSRNGFKMSIVGLKIRRFEKIFRSGAYFFSTPFKNAKADVIFPQRI
ncbi:hypothetical protein [Marinifilum flexuosum]|uniref:hypothetical protein n=1 Tax=Marinifilum flexuosum TaxID=1117708 RepID=UPI0024942ABF|nr:hypothetical protein [Marinifilum flexuosum]